jgi:RHS repeat-associated protein
MNTRAPIIELFTFTHMQERQQIPREYLSHTNFSEGWQVSGDAYTAVAVAKKTGTGSWVVYNIFRDHLGTITHLKNGSTIDEYSYDAWGRRRDKDDWNYTLSGEPALFADRGFTGHEFLSDFNLYNMPARLSHFHLNYFSDGQAGGNGRLYDPVLGRFLSPDPYIADPSFTQSYNRYSYVLNNPLKYNDPTGELPGWALGGIATAGNWLFGGMDNWINKGMSFKQSFSTAYNPIVFSANYHPGSNSWSNTQASAHQLVGVMANADRGVHSYVAGFSGMGRYGEGPLFTSTPLPQFVGESPLAIGIAQSPIAQKRVTLATGMTSDITVAFGPIGFSIESGTFKYKGIDYTIVTVGYAGGWDISAGANLLMIRGYPDTFNPYDLGGWSTQFNISGLIVSGAHEKPFYRRYNPYFLDSYRSRTIGPTISTDPIGASLVHGFTWVYPTPQGPTLTDLYKRRPGGY